MRNFSTLIQNWYLKNMRDLPWRDTNDPYKIWLSEIILQQTRVDQGLAYYLKFIAKYPKVQDLALASENDVLNNWQGLGYYSRARNLHAAAKFIHHELKGEFPKAYSDVLALKGVGEYTAAAICSIAYKQPKAVVDGNVYRVLSRYLNNNKPIDSAAGKKEFKIAAQEFLDHNNPGDHNQALMELGALICTPKTPNCKLCPLNESCEALQKGTVLQLPVKEKKTKVRKRYFNYFILTKNEQLLIKKRGPKDVWEGLYDFYLIEEKGEKEPSKTQLHSLNIEHIQKDGNFKHILSHQHIFASFWFCEVSEFPSEKNGIIVNINSLESYPLPQLLIRYLEGSNKFYAD